MSLCHQCRLPAIAFAPALHVQSTNSTVEWEFKRIRSLQPYNQNVRLLLALQGRYILSSGLDMIWKNRLKNSVSADPDVGTTFASSPPSSGYRESRSLRL